MLDSQACFFYNHRIRLIQFEKERAMRKNILKKFSAVVLALALVVPAISVPAAEAAAKAPVLTFKQMQILPDSSETIYIEKNKAKILKTTWSTSKKARSLGNSISGGFLTFG